MELKELQAIFANNVNANKNDLSAKALQEHKDYIRFTVTKDGLLERVYFTYKDGTLVKRNDGNGDIKNAKALQEYLDYLNGKLYANAIVNDTKAKAFIENAKAKANKR